MTLKPKKRLQKNNYSDFTFTDIIIVSVVVLLIGLVIGISLNTNNVKQINSIQPTQTVFAGNTLKVAKKFACSCGTCGEKNLVSCVCGTAIGTKKFIEGNLQNGMPEGEVVELVKEYYGHYVGDSQLQSVY